MKQIKTLKNLRKGTLLLNLKTKNLYKVLSLNKAGWPPTDWIELTLYNFTQKIKERMLEFRTKELLTKLTDYVIVKKSDSIIKALYK